MIKHGLSIVLATFCCTTPAVWAGQGTPPAPPRLVVSTNSVDIGRIPGYVVHTNAFRIANAGGSPLNIRGIVSTCSCISGSASQRLIPPQAEAIITLRLDANLVQGVFRRAVWVQTDDPDKPRVMLMLTGESMPLFEGVPPMPIALRADGLGAAWTNEIALTATETNVFLGPPTITDSAGAHVAITVKTNDAPLMAYTIQTVIKPTDADLQKVTATFPVTGKPGVEPRPLMLEYQIRIGSELRAIPQYIHLAPDGKPSQTRVLIRTTEAAADPQRLSWGPEPEGVHILKLPHNGGSSITLIVKVSEDAAKRLLESNAGITFTYPGHKPLNLAFSAGKSVLRTPTDRESSPLRFR